MAHDFNLLNSTSLSSHYVYYDRLKDDGYENLYNAVRSKMIQAKDAAKEGRADTSFIIAQANKEREKELNLIERMTGFRPNNGVWGRNASNIIDAINLCFESKEIYDRVSQTILADGNTKGKQAYSFFGGYLQSAINRRFPSFLKRVDVFDINERVIFEWLSNEVLPGAIKNMFNAQVEDGVDPALQGAYQELSKLVGRFGQAGSFAQQLADIYDLETVANEILARIKEGSKAKNIPSLSNKHYIYQRGGLTLEAINDLINKSFRLDGKTDSTVIGGKGAKADTIFTIDIDLTDVMEYLDSFTLGTRKENIEAFTALGEHLKRFSDGFIVYQSAKNYSLTDGFRESGGFSAGSALTLGQYGELMESAGKKVKTFVGAIEQLARGAVGQDMDKTDYADIISKNIAYLLFDDYNTIGAGLENGPDAIHIMNLNGLFVPISSILFALADAIDNEQSIRGIVKTSIKIPKIMYDTNDYGSLTPGEAWRTQRDTMLADTRIETHFLGNLQNMLRYGQFR